MIAAHIDCLPPETFSASIPHLPDGRHQGLFSIDLPVEPVSFTALLQQAPYAPRLFWESIPASPAIVGWGRAAELCACDAGRFQSIHRQAGQLFENLVRLTPDDAPDWVGPRLLGGFAFQPDGALEPAWKAFPDARFILPAVQFTRLGDRVWLTVNALAEEPTPAPEIQAVLQTGLKQAAAALLNARRTPAPLELASPLQIEPVEDLPLDVWREMVAGAVQRIKDGEFEKVVLARTLQVQLPARPAPAALLEQLGRRYGDCYRFLIEPQTGQAFLGATPELLVEVDGRNFSATALAGTARRGANPEADRELGLGLLNSAKDRHEQAIVVEAVRQKLAPLTESLKIPAAPVLRKLSNVQHLETPVHGRLAAGRGLLDVVEALHPTPAMGGWPEPAARAYRLEAEPFCRGWYAAPIGWLDAHGGGLFAVAIRSSLLTGATAHLFAGAGIVAGSDPDREWQETRLKFRPMLEALEGAFCRE